MGSTYIGPSAHKISGRTASITLPEHTTGPETFGGNTGLHPPDVHVFAHEIPPQKDMQQVFVPKRTVPRETKSLRCTNTPAAPQHPNTAHTLQTEFIPHKTASMYAENPSHSSAPTTAVTASSWFHASKPYESSHTSFDDAYRIPPGTQLPTIYKEDGITSDQEHDASKNKLRTIANDIGDIFKNRDLDEFMQNSR